MNTKEPPRAASDASDGAVSEHATTDLDLSAFLITRGIQVTRIEPPIPANGQPFASVVFPRTPELLDAIAEWSGNTLVPINPRDFAFCRRELYRKVRATTQQRAEMR